ncbi:MAG TPA: TonB-dependent receptor, partial [Chitinophagaceae bacterium]|nr:TonB-dependent receptor [Chitinophagaceae bacterium]
WDVDTKMLTVTYEPSLIWIDRIHNRIASVGHDTELKKANNAVYNKLPDCCLYRDAGRMEKIHQEVVTQAFDTMAVIQNHLHNHKDSVNIRGIVLEVDKKGAFKPLVGATVIWLGSPEATMTDSTGAFAILHSKKTDRLIISYAGYESDTLTVLPTNEVKIILGKGKQLQEVKVTASRPTTYVKSSDPFRVSVMTEKELFKAACCNLSESFETNPSVDVSYNDAVTGSKQIHLLGLSGNYTQLTVENLPGPRGIATGQGLNSIPGTWIESIQMMKGTGSVANGFESIAGQINVELRKPQNMDRLYANTYVNDAGKTDLNLNLSQHIGSKWSTALLLHDAFLFNKHVDFNMDGFRDLPTGNLFSVLNRWNYDNSKGLTTQFGFRFLDDQKTGGETHFEPSKDHFADSVYGLEINSRRMEAFGKIGYVFPEKKYQSIGLQVSTFKHELNSYFGHTTYDAEQKNVYANLIYQSIIGSTIHKFRTGFSFVNDDYDEKVNSSIFQRNESVAGAFFEYNFNPVEKFQIVAGIRQDYNNLYGWFTTPRVNIRYEPVEGTTIRLSSGRGQRTANIFAENMGSFASARQIHVTSSTNGKAYGLNPEVAWNSGISLDQHFHIFNRSASIVVEFFRNDFENQVVVDFEDPRMVDFYDLQGKSYSNSFQAELNMELIHKLNVRMAYRLFDVKTTFGDELLERPYTATHRGFANLAYEINGWKFDYTVNYNSRKRIPSTEANPPAYQREKYSPSYFLMNAQVTKTLGKESNFDIYVGAENLTNYFQKDVIIAPEQPFGPYFDASMVWGPMTGRMFYGGLRFTLN